MKLSDLLEGRLADEERAAVEQHVASCEECREWCRTYNALADVLPAHAHPTSADIAAFALEPESLGPSVAAQIAAHVAACERCSEEVKVTRQAAASEVPAEEPARRLALPPFVWGALAAGIVLAVLAYPAYLGLTRFPDAERHVESLTAERDELAGRVQSLQKQLGEKPTWSGAVGYLLLASTLRGDEATPALELRPGQPYVSLAVQPDLPSGLEDEDLYRFAIRTTAGETAWVMDMTVSSIEEDLRSFEVVLLQIPSPTLPPGDYELRMFKKRAREDGILLQAPFSIEAAE